MADNSQSIGTAFWGKVDDALSQKISATPIDLTINAEVVKLKNPERGEYLVKYQSATFSAFTLQPQVVYQIGELVYVLVPQGDFSSKKIIIGHSSAQQNLSYAEQQELTNFYIPWGPNWLGEDMYGTDHMQLGICSAPRSKRNSIIHTKGANYTDYGFSRWPYARNEENKAIWGNDVGSQWDPEQHHFAEDRDPTSYPNVETLKVADKTVQSWGWELEYIGVKAKFRTEFLSEHTHGRYGIRIEYLVKNNLFDSYIDQTTGNEIVKTPEKDRYIVKTKELSFDAFSGNPYSFVNDTEQIAYFQVPKGSVVGLNRVCLFQNDTDGAEDDKNLEATDMEVDFMPEYDESGNLVYNPANDIYDRNNIFATDIDIRWYEKKNLLNGMFLVHITSERGNKVFNKKVVKQGGKIVEQHPGIASVTLKAHLFYGGKDILDEENYEVYWYRECPDYRSASWPGGTKDVWDTTVAAYAPDGWAPIFRPNNVSTEVARQGLFVEEFAPFRVNQFAQAVPNGIYVTDENWPPVDPNDTIHIHDAVNYSRPSYRELTVPKDKVPWQWYYTCVIVQKRKAEVKDSSGNVISEDKDRVTAYKYEPSFGVQGYLVEREDSLYDLELSDLISRNEGEGQQEFLHIIDNNDLDRTRRPIWPAHPWFGNWWYRAGSSVSKIMKAFKGNDRNVLGGPETDGLVEVTEQLEEEHVEFVVGAIDPKLIDGMDIDDVSLRIGDNREMIVGILHKTIKHPDAEDLQVSWEGQRHFVYNYDGTVKSWYSTQGFTITPIVKWLNGAGEAVRYVFYSVEGVEERYRIHEIDFYDGQGLEAGEGYSPKVDTMIQSFYVENMENNLARIHFQVRNTYDETLASGKNTFWLVIYGSSGTTYGPFPGEITFQKDGLGSNGTGWSVDIDACTTPENAPENVKYGERLNFLAPLVLEDKGNRWEELKVGAKPRHELVVRPFVYKGGDGTGARPDFKDGTPYDITRENTQMTDFYDFDPSLGYWAETYWDVRFPAGTDDCNVRYNSYLRLIKPGDDAPYTAADWEREANCPSPKGLAQYPGVCAYTHSHDGFNGAIKVRWNPDLILPNATVGGVAEWLGTDYMYFVITAMTVIYRNCTNQADGEIEPNSANAEYVTCIWSYYPVDIFLGTGATLQDFEPKRLDTNWPREILYSATGISPSFSDPQDGLYFFYGEETVRSSYGNFITNYARTLSGHSFPWFPAYNQTPLAQQLQYRNKGIVTLDDAHKQRIPTLRKTKMVENGKDKDGNPIEEEWWFTQHYHPNPALNPENGMHGLLSTNYNNPEEDPFFNKETGAHEGRFYRNQVFVMSRFSNNGVNAWDGRSVSIDNDNNTIAAPTIIAGYKNPLTNDFSGVLMGVDKNQRKDGVYANSYTTNPDLASRAGDVEFKGAADEQITDNRQFLNSHLFQKFVQASPYLAGVYGYQRGVASFGLMENGTAFFGRADGGAQIVLDGSNGMIYGGGNGYASSPTIRDPMWNSMRLNLIDATRNGSKQRVMPEVGAGGGAVPDIKNTEEKMRNFDEFDRDHAATGVNVPLGQSFVDEANGVDPDVAQCRIKDDQESNSIMLDYPSFFNGVANTMNYEADPFKMRLPGWYKFVWQTATIKRKGGLPYFLADQYRDVTALPKWDGVGGDGGEYWINYWDGDYFIDEKLEKNSTVEACQRSTFRYGRASTTPAIEIGQHPDGLMPGILPWCAMKYIMNNFYIPGNRNFMVTYDGTMWAMNGVFMGNVIGSNFVGGRVQGSELGVGCGDVKEPYQFQKVTQLCDWPPLDAPLYEWATDPKISGVEIQDSAPEVPAFYVDKYGNVSASSIRIFGGSIDIGTFHIIGKNPRQQAAENKAYGTLIQFGESDFVGVVHCYGNLGVGPNTNGQSGNSGGSNMGNFTQVKGQVAMGIAYSETAANPLERTHIQVARALGMECKDYGQMRENMVLKYEWVNGNADPSASLLGLPNTLEQAAFFGIDCSPDIPARGDSNKYRGHWYPMAHVFQNSGEMEALSKDRVPGWFTTMNLFKSEGSAAPAAQPDQAQDVKKGANYFRVGCFGTEARFIFIKEKWQNEGDAEDPDFNSYLGYFGMTQRLGDGGNGTASGWAIGIQSWRKHPIICNSSCETAFRSIGCIFLDSNPTVTDHQKSNTGKENAVVKGDGGKFWTGMTIGRYVGDASESQGKVKDGVIRGFAFNGFIGFGTLKSEPTDHASKITPNFNAHDAGMSINPGDPVKDGDKGSWFWNKDESVHIIQGRSGDGSAELNEIWLSKDGKLGINGKEEAWITVGKGAHTNPEGKPGLSIKKDKTSIGTEKGWIDMDDKITFQGAYANENNQINIYARFA